MAVEVTLKVGSGHFLVTGGRPSDTIFYARLIRRRGSGRRQRLEDGQEVWLDELECPLSSSDIAGFKEYREPAGWKPRAAQEAKLAPLGPRLRPGPLAERLLPAPA